MAHKSAESRSVLIALTSSCHVIIIATSVASRFEIKFTSLGSNRCNSTMKSQKNSGGQALPREGRTSARLEMQGQTRRIEPE